MKRFINIIIKFSCGAIGIFILQTAQMTAEYPSLFGIYEPKMPLKLRPKEDI